MDGHAKCAWSARPGRGAETAAAAMRHNNKQIYHFTSPRASHPSIIPSLPLLSASSIPSSPHPLTVNGFAGRISASPRLGPKFSNDEARIINVYLSRNPAKVDEFIKAIPPAKATTTIPTIRRANQDVVPIARGFQTIGEYPAYISNAVRVVTEVVDKIEDKIEDTYVEWSGSEALRLARDICSIWLQDFTTFVPRPVGDVIRLLERLQERSEAEVADEEGETGDYTLLDILRRYMYGRTPMRHALKRSLRVFKKHPDAKNRILVLVSDGLSTDGNPLPLAGKLKQAKVTIATVYLTSDRTAAYRRLYYQPAEGWDPGRHILFSMAARVAGVRHPIPVLASMGWVIPSAGEVALHATVSSSAAPTSP